jgi:putative ABC transport system permease protein
MRRPPIAERFYRLLLRCYPGEFRDEYEQEMLQAFRDRLAQDRRLGIGALMRLWRQVVSDSVFRAPAEHVDVLRQDLRYTLRSMRRTPVFAATAIATLALGVGANTAIFSIVHAVVLRPLAFDPDRRVIRIWEVDRNVDVDGFSVSLPNYLSWKERSQTTELAAWTNGSVTLRSSGDPVRVPSLSATAGLLGVFGVEPLRGRLFTERDEALNGADVALITDGLWKQQFGQDPSIIGRTVSIGERPHEIIGVVPEGAMPQDAEVFVPLRIDLAREDRGNHMAQVVGRLRPGATLEQARGELERIAGQLALEFPNTNREWGVTLSTAYEWIVPDETRRALYLLLASVCCVLLIACANVASLMLARTAARKREIAVRMAIGAARRRIVRQVLTEGIALTALGGAAGVLLAWWSTPVIRQWLPETLPRADDMAVNAPVLLFSILLCGLSALAFATLPALTGSRADVVEWLKQGARGSTGAAARWRQLLAGVQIAIATTLLIGAGLLIQSLQQLQRVELGFNPVNLTTGMLGLSSDRYKGPDASWAFYRRLLERLAAAPGVEAAALTSGAPFDIASGGNTGLPVAAVGPSRLNGKPLQADWRMVSPGYFKALQIPLVRGELFTGNPSSDDSRMIVSAAMARAIWGEENAIGRQIAAGPGEKFTVIGIVGDVRNLDLAREPAPTMYISTARYQWPTMTVMVRSVGAPTQTATLLRTAVRELDPQLALFNVRNTIDRVNRSASQPRLNATLVGLFAAVAALLAALGIYGVLAYLVSQRRQEIGIRMALGAGRSTVVRLILGRAVWLTGTGVVAGVLGALAISRWISALMFGVSAKDPSTFAAAITLVVLVALIASYAPARRATRVDPLAALRSE